MKYLVYLFSIAFLFSCSTNKKNAEESLTEFSNLIADEMEKTIAEADSLSEPKEKLELKEGSTTDINSMGNCVFIAEGVKLYDDEMNEVETISKEEALKSFKMMGVSTYNFSLSGEDGIATCDLYPYVKIVYGDKELWVKGNEFFYIMEFPSMTADAYNFSLGGKKYKFFYGIDFEQMRNHEEGSMYCETKKRLILVYDEQDKTYKKVKIDKSEDPTFVELGIFATKDNIFRMDDFKTLTNNKNNVVVAVEAIYETSSSYYDLSINNIDGEYAHAEIMNIIEEYGEEGWEGEEGMNDYGETN